MHVGIGLPSTLQGANRDLILAWATRADEGPFASLAVFDRLVYDSLDTMASLAAAAAVTNRIRLVTAIVSSPLRNDALLAKEAATIDVLSGGRLTLGVGLGARKEDYDAAGVPYETRGRRLTDQLIALRDYWEENRIGPKPVQPGGPPLIVGGLSDHAFDRAARHADGYIHAGGPPRAFAPSATKARAAWADAGRPGEPQLWAMGYFALGDDAETAQAGSDYLLQYYAFTGPFAERVASGLLTTPHAIVQFIRGYAELGCHHLLLYPTIPRISQLDRLAEILAHHSMSLA